MNRLITGPEAGITEEGAAPTEEVAEDRSFAAFYADDAYQVRDAIGMIRKGWAPMPGAPDACSL